jgi:hypothetical protein
MRKLAQLLFPLCHSRIHIRCIELPIFTMGLSGT